MILVMSKCSIYHVESPISLIFGGPQASHFSTIFEKILGIILFYVNKSACHILVTICKPSRIPKGGCHVFESGCAPAFSGTFSNKNWVCPHRSLPLSDPKTGCARAHLAHKVTPPLLRPKLWAKTVQHICKIKKINCFIF